MKKYSAVPVLLVSLLLSSCVNTVEHIIFDDDTVCGENVNTGYQRVSAEANQVLPVITPNTRLVFVNKAGEEMSLTLKKQTDQSSVLNYKILCSNYEWNTTQFEYCSGQVLDYVFESDPVHGIRVDYSLWVDFVHDGSGALFDRCSASLWTEEHALSGGTIRFVADQRGNQLPDELTRAGEWDRAVGDTTMLGRKFHDVTYTNWGVNKGKGIFFQKGLGIIGINAGNEVIWVLDRVE